MYRLHPSMLTCFSDECKTQSCKKPCLIDEKFCQKCLLKYKEKPSKRGSIARLFRKK